MLYFECPFDVLEQGILGRARYSGRTDDNVEAMKARFDSFKDEILPTVELFKSKGKCVEMETSHGRETVYSLLRDQLALCHRAQPRHDGACGVGHGPDYRARDAAAVMDRR